jgi:hypothetical protein
VELEKTVGGQQGVDQGSLHVGLLKVGPRMEGFGVGLGYHHLEAGHDETSTVSEETSSQRHGIGCKRDHDEDSDSEGQASAVDPMDVDVDDDDDDAGQVRGSVEVDKREWSRRLLEKSGWREGQGLGAERGGMAVPLQAKLRLDRTCVGHDEGEAINVAAAGSFLMAGRRYHTAAMPRFISAQTHL